MSKKKEQKDQLLTSETPLGLLDQIPGAAPFDYTTPTVTNTQITDDPLTQYEVNRVYNNQRYAVDFSTTYRAITLTPFKEVDDTSASTGIINYIAGFFGLVTGYCHIRIPTLHDGVLPIPDVRLYGTRDYDIVAAMYPKVYQFRVSDLSVPPRSIIEVQTLDVNRNNYNLLEILEKGEDIPVAVVNTGGSSTPKPVGPPPVPEGDAPEPLATGADPCADGGNFKAIRDKDITEVYHAMLDFLPEAVLPLNVPSNIGSPPCPRTGPTSGKANEPHKGQDIDAAVGTPLFNVARGRVVARGSSKAGARDIIYIWHYREKNKNTPHSNVKGKKLYTRHMHCDTITKKVGDFVGTGEQIGTTGNKGESTGPHLHYEIRYGTGISLTALGDVIPPFRVDGTKDIPPAAADFKKS